MRRLLRYLCAAAGVLVLGAAGSVGWLKLHENELVFAAERSRIHLESNLPAGAERVSVPEAGSTGLAALIFPAATAGDGGYWVLHLHGNADSAFSAEQLRHCQALRAAGFSVMNIDYRGFGKTPGVPSENGLYEDAEAAYQALVRRGVPPDRIILMGHSLGSGPAVWLATRHRAAALVLFGAFTSIPDAAADRYPLLPVRYVASLQFDSLVRIRDVHIPVVITHSRADSLIPYSHALRLYAAANEPKRLLVFESPREDGFGGHVDALFDNLPSLEGALSGIVAPPLPARSL